MAARSTAGQRSGGRVVGVVVGALLAVTSGGLAAVDVEEGAPSRGAVTPAVARSAPSRAQALAALSRLVVANEGSDEGYDRELFDQWIDEDRDGCDTREEVLIADSLTAARFDAASCRVTAGEWLSLYEGATVTDARRLDIDYVVTLGEAWRSGAAAWDRAKRRAFANDLDEPLALIAVSASTNRSKSDDDPAKWRPPDRKAWCTFSTAWTAVKSKWSLQSIEPRRPRSRN